MKRASIPKSGSGTCTIQDNQVTSTDASLILANLT